jgi:ABC-2 type transport system permease protein
MIGTVLRITWLELIRDRVALGLTFVLPIVFFTLFAAVFSGMDADSLRPVRTTVVVEGDDGFAVAVAERLAEEERLEVERVPGVEKETALEALRRGKTEAVVVLPTALRPSLGGVGAEIEIHADRSNPLATGVVQGLVQSAAATATVEALLPEAVPGALAAGPPVRVIDALGRTGKRPSVAFFAAGLGVLFLMFAATGRSSILLEERERGVLGRLLAARVGLVRLLAGRWLFLTALGITQVSVMFVWAALAFGLDLFQLRNLAGFGVITAATAAAAAAFGLLLSALCRTRAQLSGVAVVVILILAALGGNLFPSFLMPEALRDLGRLTFNAWALEGYQKIFWYERPIFELWPQMGLLLAAAGGFFALAVALARRWRLEGGGV